MATHSSAGVYVTELDLSQRVAAASSSIAAIVGESVRGPVNETTLITSVQQFLATFGKPLAKTSFLHHSALAFLEHGKRLYVTRVAPQALYGGAVIDTVNSHNVATAFTVGLAVPELINFSATALFAVVANNPGSWNAELRVAIYPNAKDLVSNTFYVDVMNVGSARVLERYLVHLDHRVDGNGQQINIAEHINKRSALIRIIQNDVQPDFVTNPDRKFIDSLNTIVLAGGTNGVRATNSDIINGWELYRDPERVDINILINGGYSVPAVQINMIDICEQRMDCMAVLDVPTTEQTVTRALTYRNSLPSSSYAALYSPDFLVLDEYNDVNIYVPSSGHIAGIFARTDDEAALWFAPAGMNRGRLNVRGVLHNYNQGDRDTLYDHQVNATRVIPGAGIKVWGADTLQSQASALSNVSVRRLMMYLEKSLSIASLYSVFDPHDQILRAFLVDLCDRFLKPIKNARGLYAYGIQCDEQNNPPEVVAAGDLILSIFIDPALPVKRIFLTAVVNKTGAKITGL